MHLLAELTAKSMPQDLGSLALPLLMKGLASCCASSWGGIQRIRSCRFVDLLSFGSAASSILRIPPAPSKSMRMHAVPAEPYMNDAPWKDCVGGWRAAVEGLQKPSASLLFCMAV